MSDDRADRGPEATPAEVESVCYVFEDLALLDDQAVQHVLRQLNTSELGKALHGASRVIQDQIFRNMSRQAAAVLKEEMELMGPVRIQDVEQAQRKIVGVVRSLEQQGTIRVAR